MTPSKRSVRCILGTALLAASLAIAASDEPLPTPEPLEEGPFRILDDPHEMISERLERYSHNIDQFFGGGRADYETTGSFIRIGLTALAKEGQGLGYDSDLRLKLELPDTEQRLKLLIESDDDDLHDTELERQLAQTPEEAAANARYAAAVRAELRKTRDWDISTDTGIRARTPLDPFVRLRIQRNVDIEPWVLRFTETLSWYNSVGRGTDTQLDFERLLAVDTLFRATSRGHWTAERDYFDLSQSIAIFHRISERRQLVYQAATFGRNEPTIHATAHLVSIRHRQQIHRDWLFFDINPRVVYERNEDFHPRYELLFLLEAYFGEKYGQD